MALSKLDPTKLFLRWARAGWVRYIATDMRVRRDLAIEDLPLSRSSHGPQTAFEEITTRPEFSSTTLPRTRLVSKARKHTVLVRATCPLALPIHH